MDEVRAPASGAVLVIGNFDGVHLGHQALFRLCRARADALGAVAWAMTFDPHPSQVLAPDLAPPLITSVERRLELMADRGLDGAVVLRFTRAFAATAPRDFVARCVVPTGAREVVVGYDFSFGKDRQGTPEALAALCAEHGIVVHVVPPVKIPSGLVPSSTKVREYVLEGRVDAAERLLGRPFEVAGPVVHGAGRGASLGYPTANVAVEDGLLPKSGVYAVTVRLEGEVRLRPGAANVGSNPTFSEGGDVHLEVFVLGWEGGSLHGRRMRVGFVERLRPEQRFPSVDALKARIAEDVAAALRILADRGVEAA